MSDRQAHLLTLAGCSACPLASNQQPIACVHGHGPRNPNLILVGEAPAERELATGIPFSGGSTDVLFSLLREHDIRKADVWTTNAATCAATGTQRAGAVGKAASACSPRLSAELEELLLPWDGTSSRVILCLGAKAAESVMGQHVTLEEDNGLLRWLPQYQAWAVATYHPASFAHTPDYYIDFAWAVRRGVRKLTQPPGPPPEPTPADYTVPTTYQEVRAIFQANARNMLVGCDLETTGLNAQHDRILDMVFAWTPDKQYIISGDLVDDPDVWAYLKQYMEAPDRQWVWHNGKYDVQFFRHRGINARIDHDTMLLHYMLDERSGGGDEDGGNRGGRKKGYHGLKQLARKYADAPKWNDGIDAANMAAVPAAVRHPYAANDVRYMLLLLYELLDEHDAEPPSKAGYPKPIVCYERLMIPAANALANVELRGIRVDTARLPEVGADFARRMERAAIRLRNAARKYTFNWPAPLRPGSTKQLAEVLYDGMGYPQAPHDITQNGRGVSSAVLHDHQRLDIEQGNPPNPIIAAILEHNSLKQLKATFVDGMAALVQSDGRLHTGLLQHGTTSGRLSSQSPNLQNIPADSVLRELFIPADGMVMCEADYEQLEVRVAAWYSRDAKLIADLHADDFHWSTAQNIFPELTAGLDACTTLAELEAFAGTHVFFDEFVLRQQSSDRTDDFATLYGWMKKRIRRQTKFNTFGILYGRHEKALADIENGLGCTVAQAKVYRDRWVKLYQPTIDYLEKQSRIARNRQWVESATGRRRRFPYQPFNLRDHIANQASNMPVQSLASDICLRALTKLTYELPARGYGWVLLTVHDSILFELWPATLGAATDYIRDVMESRLLDEHVKFAVEIKSGPSWGSAKHIHTKRAEEVVA